MIEPRFIQLTEIKQGVENAMGVRIDLISAFGETPEGKTEVGVGSSVFVVKESVAKILELIREQTAERALN